MSEANIDLQLDQWRDQRQLGRPGGMGVISLRRFMDIMLCLAAALSVIRGAQLWYGLPTSQNEFVSQSQLHMQIMLFSLLSFSILYILIYPQEFLDRLRRMSLLVGAVVFFLVLSVVSSVDVPASFRGLLAITSLSLPMLLFRWRFGEVRSIEVMKIVAIGLLLVNLAYCAVFPHYGFMSGSLEGDMRGMFPHKNGFGHTMATLAIILLPSPAYRFSLSFSYLAQLGGFLLAIVAVVLSHSSTALVQTAIGIAAVLGAGLLSRSTARAHRELIAIVLFVSVISLAFFAGASLVESLSSAVGKNTTFSGRTYVWAALIPHIFDYPFTGHGFAMFRNIYYFTQFVGDVPFGVKSCHSTYIELLLNIGIPGTLAWVALVVTRLFGKIVSERNSALEAMARNRAIAIIVMTLVGSVTEAGQMLAPLDALPLLLLALPYDPILRKKTSRPLLAGLRRSNQAAA